MPVASGPIAGQYTFTPATGAYVFSTTDANKAIWITYATQQASPWYEQWQFNNPIQGAPPSFAMQFSPLYNNQSVRITVPNCAAEKYVLPTKQGDWVEYEIDSQAFAIGDSGQVFTQDMIAL